MYLLNILKNPTLLRGCRFIAQWDRHHSRLSRYSGKSLFIHSCIQFEQKYAQRACLTLKSILYQTTSSNHVKGVSTKKKQIIIFKLFTFPHAGKQNVATNSAVKPSSIHSSTYKEKEKRESVFTLSTKNCRPRIQRLSHKSVKHGQRL